MKRMILWLLALLLAAGCTAKSKTGAEGTGEPVRQEEPAFSVQTVRIGWREGLQELPPVRIVRSRGELQDALAGETAYDGDLPDRQEAFFTDRELLLLLLEEGSGSISHEVTSVEKTPSGVTVTVRRRVPEVCTADMAAWLLLVDLPAGTAGEGEALLRIEP